MIDRFDHIVLTVASLERTLAFYVDGLGMGEEKADGRRPTGALLRPPEDQPA